jgi:hypothetical protein
MLSESKEQKTKGSSLDFVGLARIVNIRNEEVYHKLSNTETWCGIPSQNRQFYFIDGDVPYGNFDHNGTNYTVIWRVLGFEKGGSSCV